MKAFYLLLILIACTAYTGYAQSLPIDFEGDITSADFVNFDGGTAMVTSNPMPAGINTSSSVGQIVIDGGAIQTLLLMWFISIIDYRSMLICLI